jgi:excisionase family DNA binding protein
MGMTEEDRRRMKGGEPLGVKPLEAGRLIGESRNTVYRLLAAGKLRAVKRGTTTLVLMDSIHEHMASLPAATFGAADSQAAA